MRHLPLLVALAALTFAGCGSDDDAAARPDDDAGSVPTAPAADDQPDVDPLSGDWVVGELTVDGTRVVLSDDHPVTLTVADGRVSGTAACNGYGGLVSSSYEAGGGSFVVSDLSWTEMGCEPELMQIEQQFLAALQVVDSYEVADDVFVAVDGGASGFRLVRR